MTTGDRPCGRWSSAGSTPSCTSTRSGGGAQYIDGWWKLGRRWNISDYGPEEIEAICDAAFGYVAPLIAPRRIEAFRAGSWGIGPPSRQALSALIARGVKIDTSIAAGLLYDGEGVKLDYRRAESPYRAYRPDMDDIRRVGAAGSAAEIVEIPTQTVTHGQLADALARNLPRPGKALARSLYYHLRLFAGPVKRRLMPPKPTARPAGEPDFVMRDAFGAYSSKAEFGLVVDLSSTWDLSIFRQMAEIAIRRAERQDGPATKVLVFTNHTKDLQTDQDFAKIRGLIDHIRARRPDVAFKTMADVAQALPQVV